ncbi:protein FAR1-RELATED SEQUENCE 11 isoform X2 [Abrus precatorius]|uniref:Protein FAR1-RELATED SEQUENCE n=1 Tax=Abrus precatorius TaxID=3816 RepID=A0A8B8M558_ABRPR|nr:protein FAR1-RELATED SEQUENCE 11 isoform X2 [Abrus precatorius]
MSEEAGSMLVVYDDPSDQRSLSLDDASSTEESPDETRLSLETTNDAIPYIGQRFATHDAAYEFYSEFAKRSGFSIRRHRTEGKDGVGKGLTRRYFVCHRAGNTPVKTSTESKPQRNRKSSRCGCQAYMRISKTTEFGSPEWRVTGFANHHNHELLEPNQVRFLPAYRTISDADKNRILMFAKTGISVHQMMRLMELEKCVEPGYLPFTEKDAFLGFMNGKAPQTILTDQNICLKEALSTEMPTTKHAFCIWMIVAKFPSWFNAVLGERYNEWKAEFYRLYNLESVEDFELGWREMVCSFGLHSNRHMVNLYSSRSLWALPFLRSHFLAGMTTTGQSKSINAFIQRFLSAQTRLAHFVEQVAVAVDFKDQTGEQQTMQQNLQNVCLKTGAPMESHAATVLTPFAFSKLQEQLVLAAHYASFSIEDGFLVRHHTKAEGGRKVYWAPQEGIISCSCHQFEFTGILCRHSLRVLSTGNCFQIPDRYLPIRWRRISMPSSKLIQSAPNDHAERVKLLQNMVSSLITESAKSKERLDIATEQVSILLSRIREQPISLQGIREFPSVNRNL